MMQCVRTEGLQFSHLYLTFKLDGHEPSTRGVEVMWDKLICIGTELSVRACLHGSCCCYRKLQTTCYKTCVLQQFILWRGLLKQNNNFLLVMVFLNVIFLLQQRSDLCCNLKPKKRRDLHIHMFFLSSLSIQLKDLNSLKHQSNWLFNRTFPYSISLPEIKIFCGSFVDHELNLN